MAAPRFPVSVKGVVFQDERVVLLKNEREEWELPGGRLEAGEDPRACVVREIHEELAISVTAEAILDSWLYAIAGPDGPLGEVLIVTYACGDAGGQTIRMSEEHKAVSLFTAEQAAALSMPAGYLASIRRALARSAPCDGTEGC